MSARGDCDVDGTILVPGEPEPPPGTAEIVTTTEAVFPIPTPYGPGNRISSCVHWTNSAATTCKAGASLCERSSSGTTICN